MGAATKKVVFLSFHPHQEGKAGGDKTGQTAQFSAS